MSDWMFGFYPQGAFEPRPDGRMRLYGGKGGSSAPAPDPKLIAAQIKSMGIQDGAISTMLQNAQDMLPIQKEQLQFGLDSAKQGYQQSQDDRSWMLGRRGNLSGLQDTVVNDAKTFNTAERQNQLVDQAQADVNTGFASAHDQQSRNLSRRGVNPGSGQALALDNQTRMAQAASLAGAANQARTAGRIEGYGLTDRASNALSGYPAMGMAATGAGAQFGTAGIGLANSSLAGENSGYGAVSAAAGGMGANAANMYGTEASYKNGADNIAANNNPLNTVLGAATGAAAAYFTGGLSLAGAAAAKSSDRRLKKDIKRIGQTDDGIPIYLFKYKAGGDLQVGVMADEVVKIHPDAVDRMSDGFDVVDYSKL